ncbi:MAG: hypothetical protein HYV26_07355, partial [Candidatus Hydrogenedentes bacterium]|nr:hypothetical protein [Candidatus Hydrogenedentota bacterium]
MRGEQISPADLLFLIPPWSHYAPAGFEAPSNPLMSDVVTAFIPYYALTARALHEGVWPLWNPLEYAGMPLLANCQSAVFYPPRLLHVLFELRLATTLYILLKLWLCGMTAFICARGLRLTLWPARFFSVAWMFASFNQIWANWSLPDVAAWLPVLFLGVEWVVQREYRRGFFTMSLGATLMLLAGHPETAFAMSVGAGIYFLVRLLLERRKGADLWRPVLTCGGAWLLALSVSMAQLLPFIEYLGLCITSVIRPPLPLNAAACFFVPRFFGTSADDNYFGDINSHLYSSLYPGIAVWLGVFACAAKGAWSMERRRQVLALAISAGIGVILAFNLPPLGFVHALPVFRAMILVYHLAFPVFALPLLAAMGLEQWTAVPRPLKHLLRFLPLLLIAGLTLGTAYSFYLGLMTMMNVDAYVRAQMGIAAGFAVAGLAVFAYCGRIGRPSLCGAALTALLAADLLYLNRDMNPTFPARDVFPDTALTGWLQQLDPPARIGIGEGNVPSGLFAPYGIEEWLAYDGLYPARMTGFQKDLGNDVWNSMEPLCGKMFYLHDPRYPAQFPLEERGRFELVTTLDGLEVYRNLRSFPRAVLVGAVEIVPERKELYERMRSADYHPEAVVLAPPTPALDA